MTNLATALPYAEKIEHRKTASLSPYANNARTHSADQVSKIAASMTAYGFNNPILISNDGEVIAGHGRVLAAELLGLQEVPVVVLGHLSKEQRRAYVLADNKLAELSGWDETLLPEELAAVAADGFELDVLGFSDDEITDVLGADYIDIPGHARAKPGTAAAANSEQSEPPAPEMTPPEISAEEIPEPVAAVSLPGDVWTLGPHRVMCGDSTDPETVAELIGSEVVELLHADPPYGMGKESQGVANDNLRREKLDAFQVAWWEAAAPFLSPVASAYIWGQPSDLWRLWHLHLHKTENAKVHNHLTWDKGSTPGITAPDMRAYPIATEAALFIGIGPEKFNTNSDQFWEGWREILGILQARADAAGLKPRHVKAACGLGMYSHWFTTSQWVMIPEHHYNAIAEAHPGAFPNDYATLRDLYEAKAADYEKLKSEFYDSRRFFNNTHEHMTDVWRFQRVWDTDERHGHATPKPVDLMTRIMLSSLDAGGLSYEPFGGSGSTLIAAESVGRRCFTMELVPSWVDVIVKRWEKSTGLEAINERTGQTFAEMAAKPAGPDVF